MRKKTQDDIEDDFMDAEEIPVPPPPVKATAEAEKEPLEHSGYRKKNLSQHFGWDEKSLSTD